MTKAVANEQNIERQIQKHMGCMAGFLQLFDRHHIATTKRLYSAKSLPSSPTTEMTTTSESEKSTPPSPPPSPPAELISPKSAVPLTTALNSGAAKSTWKFGKEAPRLSLDSRAVTDSKGCLRPKAIRTTTNTDNNSAAATDENQQQHRSPSVIARLMGLEPLPPLSTSTAEPELRRCASDSRAAKDLFCSRFEDFNNNLINRFKDQTPFDADPRIIACNGKNTKQASAAKFQQRKCFFDSGNIFPEPKKTTVGHNHGEIENRLRMRGLIDQPSKDLETLRQILEALQLKGLLHSRNQIERRNFVYDESPMVVVKSSKPLAYSTPANSRFGSDHSPKNNRSPYRRSYGVSGEISPSISPRRERNGSSPVRTGGYQRSNSLVKPKPLSVDIQRRRVSEAAADNRRVSPVNSPRLNSRRTGQDQTPGNNRSPRCRKPTAEIHRKEKRATITTVAEDASSSISDCSYSTSTDTERSKTEEYKDGKNLLERSAKLLHSIAEMTSTDMQPSPVSVLDSSFYKDESFTPSPVTTRRHIEFKGEVEDEPWSPAISPIRTKYEEASQDDMDHAYISDILRASHYLPEHSDVFSLLEKQQYLKGIDTSKVSKLQRKLTFDVINEIIERNKGLPPWKAISSASNDSIDKIWSEFRKLRDRNNPEDLFETICGVLEEDLAGDALNGWRDCYAEMSHSILDIERMIFKDLISDTIRDLAEFSSTRSIMMLPSPSSWPRRKLVF